MRCIRTGSNRIVGDIVALAAGRTSPVDFLVGSWVPPGVTVTTAQNKITVAGADKQAVGETAAKIRSQRPPEPYNGKGIKYTTEVIKKKAGKTFGA